MFDAFDPKKRQKKLDDAEKKALGVKPKAKPKPKPKAKKASDTGTGNYKKGQISLDFWSN